MTTREAIIGSLLGMAAGDSIGLPFEGMSATRIRRIAGVGPLRQRLLPGGFGLVSDDTEHAGLTLLALAESGGDPDLFARRLASHLRWWMAALPPGVGPSTAVALGKLWVGFPPNRSGVRSAGNGPAMRAPVLGAALGGDPDLLREILLRSTRMTHTDPRAFAGACASAAAAWLSRMQASPSDLPELFVRLAGPSAGDGADWPAVLTRAIESARAGEPVDVFAKTLGCRDGVTGFILHTVPAVVHAWAAFPRDVRGAVESLVRAGGDTDSTAAVAGGIVGAGTGPDGIPPEWLSRLAEWPWSRGRMETVACAAGTAAETRTRMQVAAIPLWPATALRNMVVLGVVLGHGARRLLPPY